MPCTAQLSYVMQVASGRSRVALGARGGRRTPPPFPSRDPDASGCRSRPEQTTPRQASPQSNAYRISQLLFMAEDGGTAKESS